MYPSPIVFDNGAIPEHMVMVCILISKSSPANRGVTVIVAFLKGTLTPFQDRTFTKQTLSSHYCFVVPPIFTVGLEKNTKRLVEVRWTPVTQQGGHVFSRLQ